MRRIKDQTSKEAAGGLVKSVHVGPGGQVTGDVGPYLRFEHEGHLAADVVQQDALVVARQNAIIR